MNDHKSLLTEEAILEHFNNVPAYIKTIEICNDLIASSIEQNPADIEVLISNLSQYLKFQCKDFNDRFIKAMIEERNDVIPDLETATSIYSIWELNNHIIETVSIYCDQLKMCMTEAFKSNPNDLEGIILELEDSFISWYKQFSNKPTDIKARMIANNKIVIHESIDINGELIRYEHGKFADTGELYSWGDNNQSKAEFEYIYTHNLKVRFEKWRKKNSFIREDRFIKIEIDKIESQLADLLAVKKYETDDEMFQRASSISSFELQLEFARNRLIFLENDYASSQPPEITSQMSKTINFIEDSFEILKKECFKNDEDFNYFLNLLANFFEGETYSLPMEKIILKNKTKTKIAKVFSLLHNELKRDPIKLVRDVEYFEIIRVLNHFENLEDQVLYKTITR